MFKIEEVGYSVQSQTEERYLAGIEDGLKEFSPKTFSDSFFPCIENIRRNKEEE